MPLIHKALARGTEYSTNKQRESMGTDRHRISMTTSSFDVEAVSTEPFPIVTCDLIGDNGISASSSCLKVDFSSFTGIAPM